MSSYELERHDDDSAGIVRVSVEGELDLTNSRELQEELERIAPPDVLLVLDLNRVLFIDSAALHVLFVLARGRGEGRLGFLVEPSAPIARALAIVGLAEAAPIGESIEQLRSAGDGTSTS